VKINYETTRADVEAWSQYHVTLPEVTCAIRKSVLLMAFTTGSLVGWLAYGTTRDFPASAIVGASLFLVIWVLGGSALRHETLKRASKALEADPTNPAIGHHTLEVTPESVTETCPHHTLSIRWNAVSSAIRTEYHLFILLRSLGAVIVPLRSFASQGERDTFIQYVMQFAPAHASAPNTQNT
jgi:hypothetical protein